MGIDHTAKLHHPDRDEIELPAVLHALSDPHRLEMVRRLAIDTEPRPCGTFDFDISKSTMTHHFRTLREAGVIEQRKDGTSKLTALRREDLDARFPGLLDSVLASESAPA
jgi:DNA-binding transcriptional ArsR family regulator